MKELMKESAGSCGWGIEANLRQRQHCQVFFAYSLSVGLGCSVGSISIGGTRK
jgi:hypothetical protein